MDKIGYHVPYLPHLSFSLIYVLSVIPDIEIVCKHKSNVITYNCF